VFLAGIKGAGVGLGVYGGDDARAVPAFIYRIAFTPRSIYAYLQTSGVFKGVADTTIELPQNLKRNLNTHKLKVKTLTQW
jgi:hypothetical protein